ncbi:MAG: TSUP family transporter, partial [Chlamydiia bacterium]
TPQEILRNLFGAFSVLVSFYFILGVRGLPGSETTITDPWHLFFFGALISVFASFLGIGGGILAMIIFFLLGHPLKSILGMTTILSMTITYCAALPLIQDVNLEAFSFIAPTSALFAFLGVKASSVIHSRYLEKMFGFFLLAIGIVILKPLICGFL